GIAVTPLANGFAATSDPARLQELCDLIQAGTLRVFSGSWMNRLPLPLTAADRDHDCWWQLSMRQIEVSRTLVFDDPRRVRTVFGELLAGNMNLGRPEHAEIIFAAKVTRKTPGTFSTRLLNRADQVTVNLSFKHSRIKIYLNYLKRWLGCLRRSRRRHLWAFCCVVDTLPERCLRRRLCANPLVAAAFRTKRLLRKRCSATCQRRRRPGRARHRRGRLQITAVLIPGP
ncbi:MAG: hypothetical protein ACRDOE_05360, partial [Streptosporangiaceae bacterium]